MWIYPTICFYLIFLVPMSRWTHYPHMNICTRTANPLKEKSRIERSRNRCGQRDRFGCNACGHNGTSSINDHSRAPWKRYCFIWPGRLKGDPTPGPGESYSWTGSKASSILDHTSQLPDILYLNIMPILPASLPHLFLVEYSNLWK